MTRLQDLRDAIFMAGPEHFDMNCFIKQKRPAEDDYIDTWYPYLHELQGLDIESCGTTGCIGGHAALLMHKAGYIFKETDNRCSGWGEAIAEIQTWFNIPNAYALFVIDWKFVPSVNGSSLYDIFCEHEEKMKSDVQYNASDAQYNAVLDHFDWLIKEQMNTEVQCL